MSDARPMVIGSAAVPPVPRRLIGRRVLVVGGGLRTVEASTGSVDGGSTMSVLFAREGAQVVVADADEQAANDTVTQIAAEGRLAFAIQADLAFEADVHWMIRKACEVMGGNLDGIVLNLAGFAEIERDRFDAAEWTRIYDLNVRGSMLCCREALPRIQDGGSIVFISPTAGRRGGSKNAAYDSSTAAIFGLMRNIAHEIAPRAIRANLVCSSAQSMPAGRRVRGASHSNCNGHLGPAGQRVAAEVANAALFFLSDESIYVTAQMLAIRI